LTDRELIARAARAEAILSEPIFVEACHAVEADILKAFGQTAPEETQVRDQLYFELHGLRKVLKTLRSCLNAGKIARERENSSERMNGRQPADA
jgi:hypothetical protein